MFYNDGLTDKLKPNLIRGNKINCLLREISPIKTDKTMSRLNINSKILFGIKFQQLDTSPDPHVAGAIKCLMKPFGFI